MKRLLWLSILFGLLWFRPVSAQEPAAQPPAEPALPGVAEVIPRLSQLTEQEAKAKARVASVRETASFEDQLQTARNRQQELTQRIDQMGDPATWSFDRLQDVRGRLVEQKSSLKKLLDLISTRLAELDAIRQEWSGKKEFWQKWRESLQAPKVKAPEDAFRKARQTIDSVLDGAANASVPLVALQKEVTALQEKNQDVLNRIEKTLAALRSETFKKTAHSFANRAYYRQFNAELWASVKSGVSSVLEIREGFLKAQGWVLGLQVLLALAVIGLILRQRPKVEDTPEWQFILRHPAATGIFVAVSALSFLYATPPYFWRLALWILAAFSASILISGLLRNPRKIFMVYLLASLTVLSQALQIISFPTPLYRLYLAFLSLAGVPLLLVMAASNRRAHGGRSDGFTISLRLGTAVLCASFLAQAGGYTALASLLIESSVKTVFLGLFAAMALRLGRGGIDYLMGLELLQRHRFFKRFGIDLAARLKGIFQVFLIAYTALYLLAVWGVYDRVAQAWYDLLGKGFAWGETIITVRMVLLAGLVLYASIVLSWVLRALMEAEFFPRKGFDRGVRDSIKKLLHYSVVLVGFLFAVSLAGMELRNFVVLAGALGIGIGFGLQNIVNNIVSGIILLFERPIKVGDMVVLEEEWGTIRKIGLRSTIVETLDQSEIIVPNSQLISEKVTNWTLSTKAARVVVPVGVAYGSNVPLVLQILQEAGEKHPDTLAEPSPSPIFTGFGDSSLDFELRVWIADISKRLRVRSDLLQQIDQRFREEGVEIPFPQRDLHLRSVDRRALRDLGDRRMEEGEKEE